MPPMPAPLQYPYTVVGVLEIYYRVGTEPRKWVGTGYLLQTAAFSRRDVVLTAAHNLVFLREPLVEEVQFTVYGDRNVYTIAARANGSLRYAIPEGYDTHPGNTAFDFAVMILQEPVRGSNAPLTLTTVGDTLDRAATLAGGLSSEVGHGNRTIYRSPVTVKKEKGTALYYPPDATEKGLSGGPVLIQTASTWSSIGVITGTGDMNGVLQGLAAPIFVETAKIINDLIQLSLAG